MSEKSAFQKKRRSVGQKRYSGVLGPKMSAVATLRENNYQLAKRLEETEQSLDRLTARNVALQGHNSKLAEELLYTKTHVEELASKRAEELVKSYLSRYASVCCQVSGLLSRACNELKLFEDVNALVATAPDFPTHTTCVADRDHPPCRSPGGNRRGKENRRSIVRAGKSTVRKRRKKLREINPNVIVMSEVKEERESAMKVHPTPSSVAGNQRLIEDSGSPFLGQTPVRHAVETPCTNNIIPVNLEGQLTMSQSRPRREACSIQSYAEPSLRYKLRRGDPFTESHPEYEETCRFKAGSRSCSVVRVAKRRLSSNNHPFPCLSAEC